MNTSYLVNGFHLPVNQAVDVTEMEAVDFLKLDGVVAVDAPDASAITSKKELLLEELHTLENAVNNS